MKGMSAYIKFELLPTCFPASSSSPSSWRACRCNEIIETHLAIKNCN